MLSALPWIFVVVVTCLCADTSLGIRTIVDNPSMVKTKAENKSASKCIWVLDAGSSGTRLYRSLADSDGYIQQNMIGADVERVCYLQADKGNNSCKLFTECLANPTDMGQFRTALVGALQTNSSTSCTDVFMAATAGVRKYFEKRDIKDEVVMAQSLNALLQDDRLTQYNLKVSVLSGSHEAVLELDGAKQSMKFFGGPEFLEQVTGVFSIGGASSQFALVDGAQAISIPWGWKYAVCWFMIEMYIVRDKADASKESEVDDCSSNPVQYYQHALAQSAEADTSKGKPNGRIHPALAAKSEGLLENVVTRIKTQVALKHRRGWQKAAVKLTSLPQLPGQWNGISTAAWGAKRAGLRSFCEEVDYESQSFTLEDAFQDIHFPAPANWEILPAPKVGRGGAVDAEKDFKAMRIFAQPLALAVLMENIFDESAKFLFARDFRRPGELDKSMIANWVTGFTARALFD